MTVKKLFDKKWFILFLIIPLYNIVSFKYIPSLVSVYNAVQVWKLVALLVIVISYFIIGRFSKIVCIISIFEIVNIFSAIINGVVDSDSLTTPLIAIGFSMLIEIEYRNGWKKFNNTLLCYLFILSCINLLLCIIYPDGLPMATLYTNAKNPQYFLAIDNGLIKSLLPMVFLAFYDCGETGRVLVLKKIARALSIIIMVATLFIVGSSTGILISIVVALLLVIFNFILKRKMPIKITLIIYIVFFVLIVISSSSSSIISWFTSLFGKGSTFTGRSSLWAAAIELIMDKPVFGYGVGDNIFIWGTYMSSHNMFLEVAIEGGIIALVLLGITMFVALYNLNKAKIDYYNFNLILIIVLAFLLEGLMEVSVTKEFFMVLAIGYMQLQNRKEFKLKYDTKCYRTYI